MRNVKGNVLIEELVELYKSEEITAPEENWPFTVSEALRFLNNCMFKADCSVLKMKRACNIKNKNFSIRFKHYVGYAPVKYITHHRIELAKSLLVHKELDDVTISEIAFTVGYDRLASFSMVFKNKEDLPPTKWKQMRR